MTFFGPARSHTSSHVFTMPSDPKPGHNSVWRAQTAILTTDFRLNWGQNRYFDQKSQVGPLFDQQHTFPWVCISRRTQKRVIIQDSVPNTSLISNLGLDWYSLVIIIILGLSSMEMGHRPKFGQIFPLVPAVLNFKHHQMQSCHVIFCFCRQKIWTQLFWPTFNVAFLVCSNGYLPFFFTLLAQNNYKLAFWGKSKLRLLPTSMGVQYRFWRHAISQQN